MTTPSGLVEQLRGILDRPDVTAVELEEDRISQLYTISIFQEGDRVTRLPISFELTDETRDLEEVLDRWIRKTREGR